MPSRFRNLMSENGAGVQAYRWFTAIGMAAVGYLAYETLQTGKDTSAAVTSLRLQLTTLASTSESRLNALSERLTNNARRDENQDLRMDRTDAKIETIREYIWRAPPTVRTP